MSGQKHYVVVTGGRAFRGRESIEQVLGFLKLFYGDGLRVLSGHNPKGLDKMAEEICDQLGIPWRPYPAEWSKHGKPAGHIRNQKMVDLARKWSNEEGVTAQVIAWPGDKGTRSCTEAGERAGLIVDYMPSTTDADTVDVPGF